MEAKPTAIFRAAPRHSHRLIALLALAALGMGGRAVVAEEPAATAPLTLGITSKTFGGLQFWSDELVFRGWRVQLNALSGGYRLLDGENFCHASGTFTECRQRLERIKVEKKLPPLRGKAVLTLHGLIRSRESMASLGEYLQQQGGFTWINVSYASTRRSLDEHAASLAKVIDGLEGIDEIHFVCHSLGNLVVRRYLGEANAPLPRWIPDPRIKRMVMLGPPNQGAQLARRFKSNKLCDVVWGPSGRQLAGDWLETEKHLATPAFEFGVIAGGNETWLFDNLLVDGEDDLVVSVAETRLAGARDFLALPLTHSQLTVNQNVRHYVLSFLDHGYFIGEAQRQPILAGEKKRR